MGGKKQRRQRSAAEKLRIVLAGQDGGTKLSELCRREGIAPGQYHQWKKLAGGPTSSIQSKPCHDVAVSRHVVRTRED